MRFLVTGAGGYVGSVLCGELLRGGHSVTAVDRPHALRPLMGLLGQQNFWWLPADAADPSAAWWGRVRNYDAVVPLAALVGQAACSGGNAGTAFDLNRDAVARLVDRVRPDARVLYLMTNSGYGCGPAGRKPSYDESDPLDPNSDYGRSKLGGEAAVLDHPNGLSFRLGSCVGVSPSMRWDLLAHDFLRGVFAGGQIDLFEPSARRNFVHVRDVARAVRWAAETGRRGVFNLNLQRHYTKREVVDACVLALSGAGLPVRVEVREVPGADPDGRDGLVSSGKVSSAGFVFDRDLADGLGEAAAVLRDLQG